MNRIETLTYGTNETGKPTITREGSWVRFDLYTSFADNRQSRERRFAAGRDDYSPLFTRTAGHVEDSRCSCCYLGFSHTVAHHQQQLAAYDLGTCPRCHIGSKAKCTCTFTEVQP